ncbi:acetyl-CoA C-acyltransferase [Patulibacter defluvii]|uniref:acetyl-CoA C-acyltransferase n=1 Tax=Patulibacter defluvii TaxID=3095358 RepID=UPI002A751FB1|nr:acetyl-CoA C-acyltransferase [Patulibacter sp. DM4]
MAADAWIVDAVRTPIGRHGGVLAGVRPDDLAATVVAALVERTGAPPARIEDVVLGNANGAGEENRNVGRMAALLAGLPHEVPGATVNRLCASGMEAVVGASRAIRAGDADLMVAGGVESMTRAPWAVLKPSRAYATGPAELVDTTIGWRFVNPRMAEVGSLDSMGETAENVAERYAVARADQDRFALASHQRAVAAWADGRWAGEVVPVSAPPRRRGGEPVVVDRDEGPRADTDLDQLARLRPAFRAGGSVTAGNSSSLNDGASALLLASDAALAEHGWSASVRIAGVGVAGVDPAYMGIGPVPATRRALARAGIGIEQLEVVELNEAFAAQALACVRELGLDPEIVNPNGGAIALGHPLGSSGARIVGSLVHEMRRRGARWGLASLCVGVGQGVAVVLEQPSAGSPA